MHTQMDDPATSPVDRFRTANLLGAFALEVATAQERATTEAIGQGGAAAVALDAVAASPGHSIEHLRGALGITQPGAARLFERLEAAGWVQRGGRGGRSGFQITLTDAGEAKLASILAARRRVLLDLLAPLDDAVLTDLTALLDQLLTARTTGPEALQRICRLCERSACHQCPVGHALDLQNAQRGSGD